MNVPEVKDLLEVAADCIERAIVRLAGGEGGEPDLSELEEPAARLRSAVASFPPEPTPPEEPTPPTPPATRSVPAPKATSTRPTRATMKR